MHLQTYAKSDAGKMLAHYDRSIGAREHIDPDGRVYNLAPDYEGGAHARFAALCDGLEIGPKTRPLADLVVTMPDGFSGDAEAFFKAAYEELVARVGEERVVSSYVHLDEPGAQPHMHFAFVPVVETPAMTNDKSQPVLWTEKDEKKNPEHKAGTQKLDSKGTPRFKRVPLLGDDGKPVIRRTATASKMFSREEMRELHPKMEAALCKRLGVERVGLVLGEDDARRQLSDLDHEDYVRVTAEIERASDELVKTRGKLGACLDEVAEKQSLSAGLDSEIEEKTARLECLQREIEQKEMESAAETVSESIGSIVKNLGAGKRAEELAGDVERLRARVAGLACEKGRIERELPGLERGERGLRERNQQLAGRFEDVRGRVTAAIGRLREVPNTLSELAREIAGKLGKRVFNPNSLDYQMRLARQAAAAQSQARTHTGMGRGRGGRGL